MGPLIVTLLENHHSNTQGVLIDRIIGWGPSWQLKISALVIHIELAGHWEGIMCGCSHTATQRQKKRKSAADSCLKPNWHKQTTSKWRLLFIWRRGREGRKREKIYLICNCQESIFTCKIASEWERLPRGRNMTAFTRVRMDHHLQPPFSPLSIALSLSLCSAFPSLPSVFPLSSCFQTPSLCTSTTQQLKSRLN